MPNSAATQDWVINLLQEELKSVRIEFADDIAEVRDELQTVNENVLQSALNIVHFADVVSRVERIDIDKLNSAAGVMAYFQRKWVAFAAIAATATVGAVATLIVESLVK